MKTLLTLSILLFSLQTILPQQIQVYFDFDKFELTNSEKNKILNSRLVVKNNHIVLKGYTDTVGSVAYNYSLSEKRIENTKDILWRINKNFKIETRNYGETQSFDAEDKNNRKVDICFEGPINNTIEPEYKEFQRFYINTNNDTIIKGQDNTEIYIPSHTFVLENNKPIMDSMVEIRLTEYYKPSEMIKAHLTTMSNNKILETGGMIKVEAYNNSAKCKLANDKQLGINFKDNNPSDSMQIFYGKHNNSKINWVLNNTASIVHCYVEQMPEFIGGNDAMFKFINNNLKYPQIAVEQGIQGTVVVQFIVNELGIIENPRIVRGIDPSLDLEALKVILKMPQWKPGKQNGKSESVQMTIPIRFRLDGDYAITTSSNITSYNEFDKFVQDSLNSGSRQIRKSFANFNLWINKMEWINCDRFYRSSNSIDIKIKANPQNELVYILLNNRRSILNYTMSNKIKQQIIFKDIPKKMEIRIVSLKISEGNMYYSCINTKANETIVEPNYRLVDLQELNRALKMLD
jgi:TonB family protein